MTNKKDPNNKHYFKSVTFKEFADCLFLQCKNGKDQPITIWEKGEREDQAEQLTVVEYLQNSKVIRVRPLGKVVTKIPASLNVGKNVLIKVPIDERTHYFTVGQLKFFPDNLIYFLEIEKDVFKSQKRKSFRLDASPVIPIQFKIDDQVFSAVDISTGGTSFLIEASDQARFSKGKLFANCTLKFDRKNYLIPEALIATQTLTLGDDGKPDGRIKIGISFKDLSREIIYELEMKITSEARGKEMAQKFDMLLSKKM